MAKNRKNRKFDKVAAVKSNARDRVGTPKTTEVITPKNKREPKYKESWIDLLDDEESHDSLSHLEEE